MIASKGGTIGHDNNSTATALENRAETGMNHSGDDVGKIIAVSEMIEIVDLEIKTEMYVIRMIGGTSDSEIKIETYVTMETEGIND